MQNKKIASEIAIGIILFLTIVIGAIFWLQGRSAQAPTQDVAVNNKPQAPVQPQQEVKNQAVDETANWQTYRNDKYGFEFSYPKEWSVALNNLPSSSSHVLNFGSQATFESGEGGMDYLGVLPKGKTLKDFVKNVNLGIEVGSASETETTINNQNVIISIMPHSGISKTESKIVTFKNDRNDKIFNIYLMYHVDFDKYPNDKILLDKFNKLINTFKFTNETGETANLQQKEIIHQLIGSDYDQYVDIVASDDSHMRVNFGPGFLLAAKVKGKWKVAYQGNGVLYCKQVAQYNFPKNMIDDCAE
ncbi:MAG TPA: hypothetical protein VF817_01875 [Patescibacteria group bacterium]